MRTNSEFVQARGEDYSADEKNYYTEPEVAVKCSPVVAGLKIGGMTLVLAGTGRS